LAEADHQAVEFSRALRGEQQRNPRGTVDELQMPWGGEIQAAHLYS